MDRKLAVSTARVRNSQFWSVCDRERCLQQQPEMETALPSSELRALVPVLSFQERAV